ncbi:MAG: phenylacetate-CoA oxygenase subunit PaaI [Robiginitomaculum sp.]|nr:MAG: phenylacetate-CoA oxygenase subunit PaaI [Robiginitomaculum sp.]
MSAAKKYIGAKLPTKPETVYMLRLADNALILGQRLSEMCGHGPEMELDMAMTNMSLDLIGQAKLLFEHILTQEDLAPNADVLALTRPLEQYSNCLLVAQPNVDFAHIMLRQYLFSSMQKLQYEALLNSSDGVLAAIAEKSLKEIAYHIRFAKGWVLRLGDGTEESRARTADGLECLWRFTGEMFTNDTGVSDAVDAGLTTDFTQHYNDWLSETAALLLEAGGLTPPEDTRMIMGGHQGQHVDNLGHILADMQFMQLSYPGLNW